MHQDSTGIRTIHKLQLISQIENIINIISDYSHLIIIPFKLDEDLLAVTNLA